MRYKHNLKKLLNLNILDYTNQTVKIGDVDMPYIRCGIVPEIDYLATYSQPSTYFHTPNTALSFFEYDETFDSDRQWFPHIANCRRPGCSRPD